MTNPTKFIWFFGFLLLSALLNSQPKLPISFKENYAQFIADLGENIKDPKFLAALKAGDAAKDKVEFEFNVSYPVSALIPTQNEIDVEKSLKYTLLKETPETILSYLNAKSTDSFAPGGPIVTAGGKYIVDGHHRWSQLYLMNPNARIKAINMKISQPLDALKFTQMAIASVTGKLPSSIVAGKNLITMTKNDFETWVKGENSPEGPNISESAIEAFKEAGIDGIDEIIEKIWSNAKQMQKQNAPIPEAPNRGLMPQTGDAPGWLEALQEGRVNIR